MSKHETPLTRAYWESLGEGTLYEEFQVVQAQAGRRTRRVVDGVVVLGTRPRIATLDEHGLLSLDRKDVIVVQTKATRLNPYVFGQALLSMDLIRQRWAPHSLRSVLICAADDPDLRPITARFPSLEVRTVSVDRMQYYQLPRWPGAVTQAAGGVSASLIAPAKLSSRLSIDGVLIYGAGDMGPAPLARLVVGQHVTSIHSSCDRKSGTAGIGMYVAGEVIMAQALLIAMGAASAKSAIVCHRRDDAVEAALRRYARFQIVQADGPGGSPS